MAFVGTGAVAAGLVKTARNTVKATWLAKNRVLTDAEIEQMQLEMDTAVFNALFAHLAATTVVTGVATVATAPGAAPVLGTIA